MDHSQSRTGDHPPPPFHIIQAVPRPQRLCTEPPAPVGPYYWRSTCVPHSNMQRRKVNEQNEQKTIHEVGRRRNGDKKWNNGTVEKVSARRPEFIVCLRGIGSADSFLRFLFGERSYILRRKATPHAKKCHQSSLGTEQVFCFSFLFTAFHKTISLSSNA